MSVILSHESVSGVRASFVKRQAFKPLNRCAPFKPTSALRVQSSNTLYPAAVNRFWIPTESPLKSKKSVHDAPPLFFCSFIFSTIFRLPTANASDHRASRTADSSRRTISTIGDELAESPLVSKSRITQIVPVSRNNLRWSDLRPALLPEFDRASP